METPEKLEVKKSSQPKRDRNNSDSPEIKTHHPVNYEDFNFDLFQFKPAKKTQPQSTNDNVPVPPIAILECPLCGSKSKTVVTKSRHLKECARKKGISFAKMMEAVELQKKQAEERRLAGLPVVISKPSRESRRNAVKRQLEPETALQADLQMALAMSISLQQKREKEEDQERFFLEALIGETQNEDKKLISALGSGSISEGKFQALPERKNRRKRQVITPFWLIRSKEETKKIHAGRVVKILSQQGYDSDEENCPFIFNWKKIRPHCTIPWPSAGHCRFWEISSLSDAIRSNSNNFYVKTLEQWFLSSEGLGPTLDTREESRKSEEIECLPSTLTALNALCVNVSLTQKDITVEAGLDGFLLDNTYGDGFFTQAQKDQKVDLNHRLEMVKRLLSMVDNGTLSDVEVIIKNGEVIHCHQFILYLNCPAAYQELQNTVDQKLFWTDISREGAITFLQFVYGGIFTGSNNKEIRQLAVRYNMQTLYNLLSNAEDSDVFYDNHDRFDEQQFIMKWNIDSGLSSPKSAGSYSPSPILTSKKKPVDRSSPVLTSESNNSKAAAGELSGSDTDEIVNERLIPEVCETMLPNGLADQSICFDLSPRKSRSSYRKLSYPGSSVMSPDLFSIVQDQTMNIVTKDSTSDKFIRIASKREKVDMTVEKPFATFCTPIHSFTPETATSTPIENKLLQSSQKAKTFSISPVLAERPACFQTSHREKPENLLASQCNRATFSEVNRSCIVVDTPERNSQDVDCATHNGSVDKIYEEESWENINYESESDRPGNGRSNSPLDSLVLESLNDLPNSNSEEVLGHQITNGKRKLVLTSLTSSPSAKRIKSKSELISRPSSQLFMRSPKKRPKQFTKLTLDDSRMSKDDELASGEEDLVMNFNPDFEIPVENIAAIPSPDPCFKLSSSSTADSLEISFERNNTWNDFPEGYNSCDNFQLMDSPLHNTKDELDLACDNLPFARRKIPQLSAPSNHSALVSTDIHASNRRAQLAVISSNCNELLENVTTYGSLDGLNDHCSDGESSKHDYDLPDICFPPQAHESMRLEECVTNCTLMKGSLSSKPTKKMPAKKTKKLTKKMPKETCVTPMPHYSIMETPVIKKELKKIGVRPLVKKKGIAVLKHVYMETHTESTLHSSREDHCKSNSPALASSRSNSEKSLFEEECSVKKSKLSTKRKKATVTTGDSLETEHGRSQSREKKTSPAISSPKKARNEQTKSSFLNEEMQAFIFVNTELRTRIIDYQPVDFKRLYTDMKAAGLKPTVQELKDFLDEQCITYTSSEELSPRKSKKRTCHRKKS